MHRNWQSGQFLAPEPVYLDATVTVGWLMSADRLHAQATSFIGDHLAASRELHVSLLGIDETVYRLLRGLVATAKGVSPGRVHLHHELKQNPQLLSTFEPNLRQAIGYLTSWASVQGVGSDPKPLLDSWCDRFHDVGGLHDAFHLALVEHCGSRSFATGDSDFRTVSQFPGPLHIISL